jgi:hypothetical protein
MGPSAFAADRRIIKQSAHQYLSFLAIFLKSAPLTPDTSGEYVIAAGVKTGAGVGLWSSTFVAITHRRRVGV